MTNPSPSGFRWVPVEATEEMLDASWSKTVATTTEERMACELGDARAAHILKMRRRYRAMLAAAPSPPVPEAQDQFWLLLIEPNSVPERKGPWPRSKTREILREFMRDRPRAYVLYQTLGPAGPDTSWGPEVLQMADGRSMDFGRKHNAQTRAAHCSPVPEAGVEEKVARVGHEILLAHSQWEKENNRWPGQQPWEKPHLDLLARAALLALLHPAPGEAGEG